MAHKHAGDYLSKEWKEEKRKDETSSKIGKIVIEFVENGFKYSVYSETKRDMMMSSADEYVYTDKSEVISALKDDLSSPHMKKGKRKGY